MADQVIQTGVGVAVNTCVGPVVEEFVISPIRHTIFCKKYKEDLEKALENLKPFIQDVEESTQNESAPKLKCAASLLQGLRRALDQGNTLLQSYSATRFRMKFSRRALKIMQQINDLRKQHSESIRFITDLRRCVTDTTHSYPAHSSQINAVAPQKPHKLPENPHKLPDFIVGTEDCKTCLVEMLVREDVGTEGYVARLGIWGPGGSGKTLLSHLVHSHLSKTEHFGNKIYFIEAGKGCQIVPLQDKLYAQVNGKDKKQSFTLSLAEGKDRLHKLLENQKCLLIIDNVWEYEVLDYLDVVKETNGSKILVTTRKSDLLDKFHAFKKQVDPLDADNSWKLFCRHAFQNNIPNDERIVSIAHEIANPCNGLPLALKVVGISMSGKIDLCHWNIALKRVTKGYLIENEHKRLFETLKLSYDALSSADNHLPVQECFLDLCLSTPYLLGQISTRWKALNLITCSEEDTYRMLHILASSSLILDYGPNDRKSELQMHDVIKNLGAYIMQNEQPGKCLNMSSHHLREFPAIKEMEMQGLRKICLANNQLQTMPPIEAPDLELLDLRDNPLELGLPGNFFEGTQNLKLVDLDRIQFEFPLQYLQGLASLEVLYLSRDINDSYRIGYFSCKNNTLKNCHLELKNLRHVVLQCYCPSFLRYSTFLEELHLDVSFECLLHLPDTLCNLQNMRILGITVQKFKAEEETEGMQSEHVLFEGMEFMTLKNLEIHVGQVPSSKIAYISMTNWKAFPNLQMLSLSNLDWKQVKFEGFTKLEELEMYDCRYCHSSFPYYNNRAGYNFYYNKHLPALTVLPATIGKLPCLKVLDVSMCTALEVIACEEEDFPKLEKLHVFEQNQLSRTLIERNNNSNISIFFQTGQE